MEFKKKLFYIPFSSVTMYSHMSNKTLLCIYFKLLNADRIILILMLSNL